MPQTPSSRRAEPEVPPVLPVVRMVVAEDGTMTVTLDGNPYLPEPFAPPWRRDSFPQLIDAITQQRTIWAQVIVVEADGRTYTDTFAPGRRLRLRHDTEPATDPTPAPEPAAAEAPPRLVQLAGPGFIAGEDVAVAVIVTSTDAGPQGHARAVFDARQLAGTPAGEVVLYGLISGTVVIGRPQ